MTSLNKSGLLSTHGQALQEGVRDGMPIALGYFVVAFTLGIAARNAGLSPFQGFLASFFNNASAGEYAAFIVIAADRPYLEMALITLVANARYLLMSCVLSQRFSPDASIWHRIFVGFDVTDEIFGISAARPAPLDPYYNYGAMLVALPGWSVGTAVGIIAGNACRRRWSAPFPWRSTACSSPSSFPPPGKTASSACSWPSRLLRALPPRCCPWCQSFPAARGPSC